MAPKALTDCPENLREAIDWLIQVNQGGGIPRLSDALDELFHNVIQDAEKSLQSLSESDDPSAGDVIDKLQTFRNAIPTDSENNDQNILRNLCSAVESLLGYQPPGTYDGSGIVYGDASRLCDAVLEFLHSVLSDVYNNQPYVVGRVLLDGLVGELGKARWSGHRGFKAVVPKVASGLGNYNQNVKASNDRVRRPISDMIDYVKEDGGELTPKIRELNETNPSESDVEEAEKLVKECVGKGKEFGKAFTSKTHKHYMKDGFDDLNASLRDKIHNARLSVARETVMLNRWSKKQHENYKTMVKLIKQAFRKLKYSINSRVRKEVTDLVDSLNGLVRNILAKLENVSKTLGKIISDLDNWLNEANEIINVALKLVQDIYDELDDPGKSKDKLDTAITTVEEKLEQNAKDLDAWKREADSVLRNAIQNSESVHTALDKQRDKSTLGKKIGEIEDSNREISQANEQLGVRVGELGAWKDAAYALLGSAISNTNQVHKNLNHEAQDDSSWTNIALGLKRIKDAKEKVSQVDKGLQDVHSNLTKWNTAASGVLGTVVRKAESVREQLAPQHKDKEYPIGHNIDKIETAKQGIEAANNSLLQHVKILEKWITDAEKIRGEAQQKAEEAYEKLDYHEKLSQNVQKILTANKEIDKVHQGLSGVHMNLGEWNQQASKVLQGAIDKATEVHDALDIDGTGGQLKTQIGNIETYNKAIKVANKTLGDEVKNLGSWKSAAENVISKAEGKCNDILKKVSQNDSEGKIFEQADKLQKEGKTLLEAAKLAKQTVEQNVNMALQAVVEMDSELKRDLRSVKENIVAGIKSYVEGEINGLRDKVKTDLGKLKEKIEGLATGVNDDATKNILVNDALSKLKVQKSELYEKTTGPDGSIQGAVDEHQRNFTSKIQEPLEGDVKAVCDEIEKLGGNFGVSGGKDNQQKFEEIFKEIQKKVAAIKGQGGSDWDNKGGSGLDGIAKGVEKYFEAFSGKYKFKGIAGGWLDAIVGKDETVGWFEKWITDYIDVLQAQRAVPLGGDPVDKILRKEIVKKIKDALESEAGEAGNKVEQQKAQAAGKIKESIDAVRNGCNTFVTQLDQKFKGGIEKIAEEIERTLEKKIVILKHNNNQYLHEVLEIILIALRSSANQVAAELDSILLADYRMGKDSGTSIAAELDKALGVTKQLDGQLTKAVEKSKTVLPDGSQDSPTQSVDKRLAAVSKQVEGLGEAFKEVKKPLDTVVIQLTTAVDDFNKTAEAQIKAAAKTAIDKAAGQISEEGEDIKLGANGLMEQFDTQFTKITHPTTGLKSELEKKVTEQIGDDDPKSGGGAETKVDLNTSTSFTMYDTYVRHGKVKSLQAGQSLTGEQGKNEGKLPEAIGKIRSEGLLAFTENDVKAILDTGKTTFENPFNKIKSELHAIAGMVDSRHTNFFGEPNANKKGVTDFLAEVLKGLGDKELGNAKKGLEKITKAIENLHTGKFTNQPNEIEKSISTIKGEFDMLRIILKNDPKDDVINALTDLKNEGVLNDKWTLNAGDWKNTKSLTTIQKQLKNQNETLPTQTAKIADAIDAIRWELKMIGIKLHDDLHDDIADNLKRLKDKIGKGDAKDKNLQHIYKKILMLQEDQFTHKPIEIRDANRSIKRELGNLRHVLQGKPGQNDGVINALNNLKGKGLTKGRWDEKDINGLDSINSDLKHQQDTLSRQHPAIETGVKDVTDDLTRLQGELQQKVSDKLTEMRSKGLTNSEQQWEVDGKKHNGLTKITNDIKNLKENEFTSKPIEITQHIGQIKNELDEQRKKLEREVTARLRDLQSKGLADGEWNLGSQKISGLSRITSGISDIKSTDVGDVRDKLSILRSAIWHAARDTEFNLKLVKDNMIGDRLGKIRDDLQRLHITLVKGAIKECEGFINTDADVFKQRCIDELTKYVNQELEAEENKLLAEARRQYVSTIKDMLSAFAAKVETELEELPKEIDDDLKKDFKGLMSKMQGEFNEADKTLDDVNINLLKDLAAAPAESAEKIMLFRKLATAFKKFWSPLASYVNREIVRVNGENNAKRDPVGRIVRDYSRMLLEIYDAFNELLHYLEVNNAFDHRVPGMLDDLKIALAELRPENFQKPSTPLLDTLKRGLHGFVAELGTAYVSAYSGATLDWRDAHNPGKEKCAKVLLSIVPILRSGVEELNEWLTGREQNWWHHTIHMGNKLGDFLTGCGFTVPAADETKPAELQNSDDMKGKHIHGLLTEMVQHADQNEHLKNCSAVKRNESHGENNYNLFDILACLCCHLNEYYQTCHLKVHPSPRTPCSVYQMLCWLTGLPHNRVYERLKQQVKSSINNSDDNSTNTKWYMAAQPKSVTATNLAAALHDVTSQAPTLLTRVLGYGNAFTTYAVDFYNNSLKLEYPQDGDDCLHLLLHIIRLTFPVLRFLFSQCSLPAHQGGWEQCKYGKGVMTYNWQCNPPLSALPSPHPECTDQSPLMSYLNDCLPGHLPHHSPNGMPCLTLLGFRGFSGSTRTGKELCKVLTKFFANRHLSSLLSLQPRPPTTLAEHICFASSLVGGWQRSALPSAIDGLQYAFTASITGQSMTLYRKPSNLTDALSDAYGNGRSGHGIQHSTAKNADLSSLSMTECCTLPNDANVNCAPYLNALCSDTYYCLPHRHADLYLSWAVYLPWRLWELLYCLFTAFQAISCRDWGCETCLHEEPCDPGSHGVPSSQSPGHSCRCRSTVQCRGVMPTLYSYGLTFGDAQALISQNKNCSTLAKQLSQVLHSDHFTELFDQCDEYLWKIRTPFFFTIAVLWAFTLFYILGVLLYRMDVLRIRSHLLTNRASHLIDVKALLTKGRKMLSLYKDVDYFDDDFHS
ncbi:hypothetical protein, conserved [Babesia ovata]|uniref:Extracellular matrix-binding ebh n=1 Tax=Babesia ovata TaxID=189622 RepID=A0A2H6K854_9APIC|nr:uncharacterized protein BOVATA_006640 [Babesia ovata]GBE59171.1 hypothetical protein, conserved [Babesia ovata]